ncbi:MAG: CBS domain-containing protein [Deltaproteobacteria bacterium]|nr:CBS domain-containing protein [Deltaproteobacteria bacterium]
MEVITTHVNADFDTIASMVAARKLYTDAVIVLPGTQEETVKGFLIQSAFYALEVRKAREIDLSKVTRVILVDIRNSARIGVFGEVVRRPGVDLHIYDHHPEEEADLHGSVEVIRSVGSTTTILVEILKERGIPITPDEATVMMLGIYEDTGSLIFPSTTVSDYLAAAHLLSCGANLGAVSDILAKDLTSDQISLLYDLIQGSKSYTIHGVEVVIAEARREEYVGDLAVLVHKLRDMEAVNVLFAVCQMGERVVIVGRSRKPEVDVGAVMRELGGGGHPYAASANIKGATTFQVREKIFKALSEKVIQRRIAADLMVSPVRSAMADDTISDVHEQLTRFNINALPVLRKNGELVGIISRQVVEKALFHGLGTEKVSEYTNTDFETVEPGEGIDRVQEIIIRKNQRLVPVVSGDQVTGIITRMGLLRFLHEVRDVPPPDSGEDVPAEGYLSRHKNVAHLMKERLPARVMELLRSAGEVAEGIGMSAYVVGGFVRDLVMRIDNLDVDIVIEGDGIEFAEAFARERPCRVRPHHKFGTAVLIFPDGFKIDVATARVEYYLEPAALPNVEYSSIKQDLYRRDFTMNTLAVRLNRTAFGQMIDFYGAQRDIKERVIRVLHSLSFVEDPSRILRASRFERRFGFIIGRHTLNLIRNAVRLDLIGRLPKPRLFGELELILQEEDPTAILRRLSEFNIGPSLHPRISLDRKHLDLLGETAEILVWFSLLFLEEKVEKWGVLFLALLDPLTPEEARTFTAELGVGRRAREWVYIAKFEAEESIRSLLSSRAVSRKMIFDCFSSMPNEVILYMMAKSKHPDIKRYISLYFTQLKNVRPQVTGKDLIALGYQPGPGFKRIFDEILERMFTGELKTKDAEISFVLSNFPAK